MYQNFVKVVLDFIVALILAILVSPLLLVITLLLFFANKGKPFFLHKRPGKNGKLFTLFKFRTMKGSPKDKDGNFVPDVERITRIGGFVRDRSIDELPQVFNILLGHMSFVGPRPFWAHYADFYNDFQRRRLDVRPGITGWAQINGRNSITWDEKFEYDVWYVDHISFATDINILFKTVKKVISREGVAENDTDTMTMWTGNEN